MRAYACGTSHRGYKGLWAGYGHPEVWLGQLNSEVNSFCHAADILDSGARWDCRALTDPSFDTRISPILARIVKTTLFKFRYRDYVGDDKKNVFDQMSPNRKRDCTVFPQEKTLQKYTNWQLPLSIQLLHETFIQKHSHIYLEENKL